MKPLDVLIHLVDYNPGVPASNVTINVEPLRQRELPEDVEGHVIDNWARHVVQRRERGLSAEDKLIAFLQEYDRSGNHVTARVFNAGYRYNQWFNRDDKLGRDTWAANAFGFNCFASWILAVCDHGNTVIFGNKRDSGSDRVSGFGGFTAPSNYNGETLDVGRYIDRKLHEELGFIAERVTGLSMIGLNFIPWVGTRGFDGIYVATINGTPEELQAIMVANEQFGNDLILVSADPYKLVDFLNKEPQGPEQRIWTPTTSCIGGVLNYIGHRWGEEGLRDALRKYHRGTEIHINRHIRTGHVTFPGVSE
jgi:hypothetical protein